MATAMLGLNTVALPELVDRGYYHAELAELGAVGVLAVHDELLFRVPTQNAVRALAIIKNGMENPFTEPTLAVQLKVDGAVCGDWSEK